MLEAFPAHQALCIAPPWGWLSPTDSRLTRARNPYSADRNRGRGWQRLGALLSLVRHCQSMGILFLQVGNAKWGCSVIQPSQPCGKGVLHEANLQFKPPAEHLIETGRAKPVLHPASLFLCSPLLPTHPGSRNPLGSPQVTPPWLPSRVSSPSQPLLPMSVLVLLFLSSPNPSLPPHLPWRICSGY